jgi:prepilin-type processing-associated H-X9-DG protein
MNKTENKNKSENIKIPLNQSLSVKTKAVSIIFFSSLIMIPIILFIMHIHNINVRLVCGQKLRDLWVGIIMYADDFKTYPVPEKWCDLLIEKEHIGTNQFSKKAFNSIYAINPDCDINSPNNVLLAFETKSGWNQHGGPELLTFENHQGKGVHVLFNDGHVEFIKPEDIGKLKWKAEEPNSSPE